MEISRKRMELQMTFLIISRISNIYESSTKVINNIVSIIVEVDCSSVDSCSRVTGVVRILIAKGTVKIRRIYFGCEKIKSKNYRERRLTLSKMKSES